MTVTYRINPSAVWDDGTPITSKDFECQRLAATYTPGSVLTSVYQSIERTDFSRPDTYVVVLRSPLAAWQGMFSPIATQSSRIQDCRDVSRDFADVASIPSGGRWRLSSLSSDRLELAPNPAFWGSGPKPRAARVVVLRREDDGGVAALTSGEADMIFPQASAGLTEALDVPGISVTPGYGASSESLWFNTARGPLADRTFRAAFAASIDRDLLVDRIYEPLFLGARPLTCAAWVPTIGRWCDDAFADTYDPSAADELLSAAGWTKNGEGLWEDLRGAVPRIRWVTNGNARRLEAQAVLIPQLRRAGFDVVADNADSATVFEQRYPELDYDLAMFIYSAGPDPSVTSILSCDQVPSERNGRRGQNTAGYCNPDADQLMLAADTTMDPDERVDLVHRLDALLASDAVTVPLYQFPSIVAYRSDRLMGPIDAEAANYMGPFVSLHEWQPIGSDTITIAAEQWPSCINPMTQCANSSWMGWLAAYPLYPSAWRTTGDGTFELGDVLAGPPTVEISR